MLELIIKCEHKMEIKIYKCHIYCVAFKENVKSTQ